MLLLLLLLLSRFSRVWLFVTLWTVARQVPLSVGILQARILEWVVISFSRSSSQLRDRTQVSRIVGGFFTIWATREAREYWSGWPISSPGDLPDPGIQPAPPALQADSLPSEPSGKPGEGFGIWMNSTCQPSPGYLPVFYKPGRADWLLQGLLFWQTSHPVTIWLIAFINPFPLKDS